MTSRSFLLVLFAVGSLSLFGTGCQASPVEETPVGEVVAAGQAAGSDEDAAALWAFAKNPDGYSDIEIDDLARLMVTADPFLVNTHVPYEGDIVGTDTSIAYDEIEQHLDGLPADKEAPIVLYCRSGRMSTEAAEKLVDLGYTNILELDGGFRAWQAAGLDFENAR